MNVWVMTAAWVATLTISGCGSKSDDPPAATGPTLTPGMVAMFEAFGRDCTFTRDGNGQTRTCKGSSGSAQLVIAPNDRLRSVTISVLPMTLPSAKAVLAPSLNALLKPSGRTAVEAKMSELNVGGRAVVAVDDASVEIQTEGRAPFGAQYTLTVRW